MKTKLLFYIPIILIAGLLVMLFKTINTESPNQSYETASPKKEKGSPADGIIERVEFEYNMLRDPATGKIPRDIREKEVKFALSQPEKSSETDFINSYKSLGPDNLGGRTRAAVYDKRSSNIILAGGISSGIYKTSNAGANWKFVSPEGVIHNVSSIVQDPGAGHGDTWYYGTGELIANSARAIGAPYMGNGIFKSVDNGDTWNTLNSTVSTLEELSSPFDYVFNLVIHPTTRDIYAACYKQILRSQDGGNTWQAVLGQFNNLGNQSDAGYTDIGITQDGLFYAAFSGRNGVGFHGVWASTSGDSASWLRIGGDGSPIGWKAVGMYGRVALATAPSNNDILYVLYHNSTLNGGCPAAQNSEGDFFVWNRNTATWTNRSNFMPNNEAPCSGTNSSLTLFGGYCQVIKVKPDNHNIVLLGGTNAYRSTDGFSSHGNITRIGGYASNVGYVQYANHHADIHAFAFDPMDPNKIVCGDDGGIQHTNDVSAVNVAWMDISNEYVTYQYYHVSLDPTAGSQRTIGGAQDNGATRNRAAPITSYDVVASGDGGACGINTGNTLHYISSQFGCIDRRLSGDPPNVSTNITPDGCPVVGTQNCGTRTGCGIFVTNFHLDPDNTEVIYCARSDNLFRTTSATTVTSGTWTQMNGVFITVIGDIMSMATTRGPYAASSKLYIGTDRGNLYRLNDPRDAFAVTVPDNIGSPLWSAARWNLNAIAVDPTDDKKVMVVFSNYGSTSIWYTDDASVAAPNWRDVEGNLSLPSIRSCAIGYCNNESEYYVGTSVGLWSTKILNGGNTKWYREGAASVRLAVVSELRYRPGDGGLLVGTHGNGMYFTRVCPGAYVVDVSPRNSINPINTEHCVSALVLDSSLSPLAGRLLNYRIYGAHQIDSFAYTDTNGVARICYTGTNLGKDTIVVSVGNILFAQILDTVYKTWQMVSPVELTSFTSSLNNRNVTLKWTTEAELNNSGFDIERREARGETQDVWLKIGFVQGRGTVSTLSNYNYEDKNLNSGKYNYRLKQIDYNGNFQYYDLQNEVIIGTPDKFTLHQNYPNPFNPATKIKYDIAKDGLVTLKIYDITGREIKTLVNEFKSAGYYTIEFNGYDLTSGAYFYKIESGDFVDVKRMILLK